jgi:hypothetical protein
MGYVRQEDGIVLASATCPVIDCTTADYQQAERSEVGSSGDLELATLIYQVQARGALTLEIADLLLVDTAGQSLLASSHYQADLANSLQPSLAALDLSGNQVINQGDAYMAVSAWRELQRDGRCLHENVHHYDVNSSGCLNGGTH